MKKFIAMVLVLVLAMSLVACGGSSDGGVKKPSNVTGGDTTTDVQQEEQVEEATISEIVLVDEADVKITAKSLEMDEFMGPEVKLLIENNSGKDLTFQCGYAAVNGYMVDTTMSVDVANGKKANDGLTLMKSGLEDCGIDTIADMEIAFHIFETSNFETYLDTEAVQIKTSIADTYEYTYDDSGEVAYEGEGVKIVIKGISEDASILGPGMVVYIENTGNKDVTVQTNDVSVNGYMIDTVFSSDVIEGKRAVDAITFLKSDLEENGITDIKDVELSFHIMEKGEWGTGVDTDAIKITF